MGKPTWKKFPHADKAFAYAGAALKKNWERLHRGDCEPFPADDAAQAGALPRPKAREARAATK